MLESPAISSGSHGVSFNRHIRQDDMEKSQLETENLDLKIENRQLRRQLVLEREKHKDQLRRISGTPPMENYYGFEDDDTQEGDLSDNTATVNLDLKEDSKLMDDLRRKLKEISAERDSLTQENDYLSKNLEQVTCELETERDSIKKRQTKENLEKKNLKSELENRRSECSRLQKEYAAQKEAANMMKQTMSEVIQSNDEQKKVANERAEQLHEELKSTLNVLEQERTQVDKVLEQLANTSKAQKQAQKEAKDLKKKLDTDKDIRQQAERKVRAMEDKFQMLRADCNQAKEALKAEREKSVIWRKSSEYLRDGHPLFSSDDNHIRKLTDSLEERRAQFSKQVAYDKNWREDVLDNMNFCLTQLYRSVREVEAKREQFVHDVAKKEAVEMVVPDGTEIMSSA